MKNTLYRLDTHTWTVERAVFLFAGILVIVSVLLGWFVDQRFFWFTAFVGGMLIQFSLTGWCPAAIVLAKLLGK